MDKEKYQEIFDQAKKNSIGSEKQDPNKRITKKVKMMVTIPVLIGTLTAAGVLGVGCAMPVKNPIAQEKVTEDFRDMSYRDYGYSNIDIDSYAKIRALEKLSEAGFTADSKEGFKYHIDATAEDFKRLGELDSDHVYSLEEALDEETMDKVLESMGYEDIDDYLVKNNFVDSKGEAYRVKWFYDHMNNMADEMHEQEASKGVSK
ncbi:MAG: hypothetical protein IKG58_01455 [Bacilli bacterium]|nr:hypothetical protein [Bacilli bacterium]